jgi:hypothetical protein
LAVDRQCSAQFLPATDSAALLEAKAAVEESGETPLEYMIRVMRDPKADARRRDAMAAAAAPYVHQRLSSTEHNGAGDGPVQVIIKTGFTYGDDDDAQSCRP